MLPILRVTYSRHPFHTISPKNIFPKFFINFLILQCVCLCGSIHRRELWMHIIVVSRVCLCIWRKAKIQNNWRKSFISSRFNEEICKWMMKFICRQLLKDIFTD